jgi:hypothetical protein
MQQVAARVPGKIFCRQKRPSEASFLFQPDLRRIWRIWQSHDEGQEIAGIIARMTTGSRLTGRISYLLSLFATLSSLSVFPIAIIAARTDGGHADEVEKEGV